jgi:K+-dependent Na+/Ca+ exchanger-like protein
MTFYALARIVDVFFIQSLEIISKKLKLSSDIAGATFMAMGSSAPELFVAFLALFRISEEMSIGAGTIVGSAIFNILVIIGASALFRRALLTWQPVIRDLLFYVVSILLLLFVFMDGEVSLLDAALLLAFYIGYLFSFGAWRKLFPYQTRGDINNQLQNDEVSEQQKIQAAPLSIKNSFDKALTLLFFDLKKRPQFYFVNFLISIALIGITTHFMIESAVSIAHFFGIPSVVIGLTILAAGTSVPDLIASVNVAKRGYGDMAIANAVGSNIFDIAIGLGLPWLFVILWRGNNIVVDTASLYSSAVLLFATVIALLFLLIAKRWEIGRYAGILLIGAYIGYVLIQIGLVNVSFCINIFSGLCLNL